MHKLQNEHMLHTIQFSGSSQALAETVATITNDFMNFEPSDVSVTATLIRSLTQDAVQDPQVLVNIRPLPPAPISKLHLPHNC